MVIAIKKPCIECGVRPKWSTKHRCYVCFVRSEGITFRVAVAQKRLSMVPPELLRKTVPAALWPPGTRWCAGCQTFVDLADVATGLARCRPCVSAKAHGAAIAKTYGVEVPEYDRLLALQGGKCAICRARPKKKRLAIDHDHKTMVNRGLLCARCNHDLLGAAHDSRTILLAAVAYLDTPPTSGYWLPPEGLEPPPPPPAPDDFVSFGADAPDPVVTVSGPRWTDDQLWNAPPLARRADIPF